MFGDPSNDFMGTAQTGRRRSALRSASEKTSEAPNTLEFSKPHAENPGPSVARTAHSLSSEVGACELAALLKR